MRKGTEKIDTSQNKVFLISLTQINKQP